MAPNMEQYTAGSSRARLLLPLKAQKPGVKKPGVRDSGGETPCFLSHQQTVFLMVKNRVEDSGTSQGQENFIEQLWFPIDDHLLHGLGIK